jgi:KUP system potassium uptake protein
LALRTNVEHNHVLQKRVVILNIEVANVPHVAKVECLTAMDVGLDRDGITHLQATFGFQDEPDVPATLRLAADQGLVPATDLQDITYFLSRITIVRSHQPTMPSWQKRLFLTIAHNSANPVEYFGLPIEGSISMGAQIPI